MSLLLTLFVSFFQVGLFAFGGGLAALPLIREQVVVIHPGSPWAPSATW